MATAFQSGDRFRIKGDIEKTIYVFYSIVFDNGVPEIHCTSDGKEIILNDTSLFDIEHI